eukprot:288565-Pelagomonas_calceolata.AAC.1
MGEQGIPISQIGSPSQEEAQPQLTWEGPCREAVAWNLPLTGGYVPSEIVQAASQRCFENKTRMERRLNKS